MPTLKHRIIPALTLTVLLLTACSQEPPAPPAPPPAAAPPAKSTSELVQTMIEKLGGQAALEGVQTMVLKGDGMRTRLGQIQKTGGEDVTARLRGVTETIDLANGRAAYDYDVVFGEGDSGFAMHRTEALTKYQDQPIGWGTNRFGTMQRPNEVTTVNGLFSWATQNTPEMLLRRNIVTIALAALKSATPGETAMEHTFNGKAALHGTARLGDETVNLYFNPETGLLDGYGTLDTETMLGDVEAQYVLGDYRAVGNLTLPHSITINKGGAPFSSITYTSIAINDPAGLEIFTIPEDVTAQADQAIASDGSWAPLKLTPVADKVLHAEAFSHNSMVVEFPTFVAVVEGAYTEAQSLTLARMIQEQIGKPIKYVIPTHPHHDHTGGIRGLAAVGATVLVAAGHEAELRGIVESPHTNPPDELARRKAAGQTVGAVEVFTDKHVITDGDQSMELYEVHGIPHVDPAMLAFVPSAGAVFQSDLFSGGPGPDATALLEAIRARNLDVKLVVAGHGPTMPFSALVDAVEKPAGNQ
jgi:glyoxylase-like metal-dependent hydrolase (beta-lactamase superfamily II)